MYSMTAHKASGALHLTSVVSHLLLEVHMRCRAMALYMLRSCACCA
jgi:hypothetical protein